MAVKPIFMRPVPVTTFDELDSVKQSSFPKLVTVVEQGIYFAISSDSVFYYDGNDLVELENETILQLLFANLQYSCLAKNCIVYGVLNVTDKDNYPWIRNILKYRKDRVPQGLENEDVTFTLLDLHIKGSYNTTSVNGFSKTLIDLSNLYEYLNEQHIKLAKYEVIKDYSSLIEFAKTSLSESKFNKVIVRGLNSTIIDNINYDVGVHLYTNCIELSCSMMFRCKIDSLKIVPIPKERTKDMFESNVFDITTYLIGNYNKNKINISLANPYNNPERDDVYIIRKLFNDYKEELVGRYMIFTAFAASTSENEIPIGASYLKLS